jgi:hypothetical protein
LSCGLSVTPLICICRRWHYDIHSNKSLAGGEHNISFVLNSKEREKAGTAQLCSVEVLEFGDDSE